MNLSAISHHRFLRFASLLALWAMLLSVWLPLLHSPAAMAGALPRICHVAVDDHKPAPQPQKSLPSCPICQSVGQLAQGFVAPESVVLAAVQFAADVVQQQPQSFSVFEPSSVAWPRAPPMLA